ncbi:MAG: hypothetical protein QOE93_1929 [Actinomycetota bacterium]|nr:hypothetical protein [Actinomycetota bacterium]
MYVSDLRHFPDLPPDVPAPARRMAGHLALIVRAATAAETGGQWVSALPCERRPGHRPCPGYLSVSRSDVAPSIRWWCTSCADEGVISGWERSPFDLRSPTMGNDPAKTFRAAIPPDAGATLRSLLFLDSGSERLVFRAERSADGIVLAGAHDDLEQLIDSVAAEANHEDKRRRQKRLDDALDALEGVLKQI